ncbi:PREDICTED: uncharacterized protein LOC109173403 [Ipomoea nil]|uniref:uncharacterized protein LOC109173403 n=1 Tax=Ipomoea nil TaxID=35883 RepID=UPI0009016672|nr:PREDICTED: uncharacterized protein LOC109173403 [Ipomoea nil]
MGLMDQQTGTWDQDILKDIFIPEDVIRILKVHVSPDYEDLWYWYGDPRGEYSVKDGYRKIIGDYTGHMGGFDKLLKLWKLKIPPKWKTFLWRTLNDILPTTNNLLMRRVDIDPTCAMCGLIHEDIVHSLITYDDEIVYAVALLYYIWRTRNGAVWDAYLPRPRKVIAMATSAVNAWKLVHHGYTRTTTTISAVRADVGGRNVLPQPGVHEPTAANMEDRILPPIAVPQLLLPAAPNATSRATQLPLRKQCFFDAAYSHLANKAGVGAIILNGQGGFISAMSAPIIDCFSPLMVEAFACKEVLSWLRARGVRSIELFTDCLILQQYLSSMTRSPHSYLGYAIDSCRTSMLAFDYCSLCYVPRVDNYLAHTLASTAFTQSVIMYSDSDPPDSISAYFE